MTNDSDFDYLHRSIDLKKTYFQLSQDNARQSNEYERLAISSMFSGAAFAIALWEFSKSEVNILFEFSFFSFILLSFLFGIIETLKNKIYLSQWASKFNKVEAIWAKLPNNKIDYENAKDIANLFLEGEDTTNSSSFFLYLQLSFLILALIIFLIVLV